MLFLDLLDPTPIDPTPIDPTPIEVNDVHPAVIGAVTAGLSIVGICVCGVIIVVLKKKLTRNKSRIPTMQPSGVSGNTNAVQLSTQIT